MGRSAWLHSASLSELEQGTPLADIPAPRHKDWHQPMDSTLAPNLHPCPALLYNAQTVQHNGPDDENHAKGGVMVKICLNPPALWNQVGLSAWGISAGGGWLQNSEEGSQVSHSVCWALEQSFNPTNNPCNKKHWFSFYLIRGLFSHEHSGWFMNTYCSTCNCAFSTAQWKQKHVGFCCLLYIFKIFYLSVYDSFYYA